MNGSFVPPAGPCHGSDQGQLSDGLRSGLFGLRAIRDKNHGRAAPSMRFPVRASELEDRALHVAVDQEASLSATASGIPASTSCLWDFAVVPGTMTSSPTTGVCQRTIAILAEASERKLPSANPVSLSHCGRWRPVGRNVRRSAVPRGREPSDNAGSLA